MNKPRFPFPWRVEERHPPQGRFARVLDRTGGSPGALALPDDPTTGDYVLKELGKFLERVNKRAGG